jgi:hypothetical protein
MMTRFTVTIIVVSNAGGARLEAAYRAVEAQTRPAERVLIVERSRHPGARRILERRASKDRQVVLMGAADGQPLDETLNSALAAVRTDFVVVLDRLERLEPTYLEKTIGLLEAHPEADVCCARYGILGDDRNPGRGHDEAVSEAAGGSLEPGFWSAQAVRRRMNDGASFDLLHGVVIRTDAFRALGGFFGSRFIFFPWFVHLAAALRSGLCVVEEELLVVDETERRPAKSDWNTERDGVWQMIGLLRTPAYESTRKTLVRAPGFFSRWGLAAIKMFLSRPDFWPHALAYVGWRFDDSRRREGRSWIGMAASLPRRFLPLLRAEILGGWEGWNKETLTDMLSFRRFREAIGVDVGALRERNRFLEARVEHLRSALEEHRSLIASRLDPLMLPQDPNESPPADQPSILINTMPKTGTYFLGHLFANGLGLKLMILSNQYFPYDVIYPLRLRRFIQGGFVSQDHFDASPLNVEMLKRMNCRPIVHVRDPRQATLSYVHFLDTEQFREQMEETRLFVYPPLPEDFYSLSLPERLDWGIDHWLPRLIEWTEGWVKASESDLPVSFTRFEDMADDQDAFIEHVLDLAGIDPAAFAPPNISRNGAVHFRLGEKEEWRRSFSPAQIERANKMIPESLADRFGWSLAGAAPSSPTALVQT